MNYTLYFKVNSINSGLNTSKESVCTNIAPVADKNFGQILKRLHGTCFIVLFYILFENELNQNGLFYTLVHFTIVLEY